MYAYNPHLTKLSIIISHSLTSKTTTETETDLRACCVVLVLLFVRVLCCVLSPLSPLGSLPSRYPRLLGPAASAAIIIETAI